MGRAWALLGVAYAFLVAIGLVAFLSRDPIVRTRPLPADLTPESEVNVAHFTRGSWLVASSYDLFHSHHPLFAIDGESDPTSVQKWVSLDDSQPWLEVHFAAPVDVERVVLVLAGAFERNQHSTSDFVVSCFQSDERPLGRAVTANADTSIELELECDRADGVRVDFNIFEDDPLQVVRLYELEVWGRPVPIAEQP